MLAPIGPAQADTIFIRQGGDGEVQISTPWGDYAAYDEGGGSYWVGTQKEFDRLRVIGIMQEHGARLSTVGDPSATATFVESGSFRTQVGSIALDEIVPAVEFSGHVTGPNAANFRQVSVLWIQRSRTVVTCAFYNEKTHQSLGSNETEDANQEWRSMVFAMPRSWLTQPVLMVFFTHGMKPGVVKLKSIASANYQYSKSRVAADMGYGISSTDDRNQMVRLERLDPSLARISPTPEPQASPTRSATAIPSAAAQRAGAGTQTVQLVATTAESWDGTIDDATGGRGELQLSFAGENAGNGGTFNAIFRPGLSNHGEIANLTRFDDGSIRFYLQSGIARACPYVVVAKIDGNGVLQGSYQGYGGCTSNNGSFSLKLKPVNNESVH